MALGTSVAILALVASLIPNAAFAETTAESLDPAPEPTETSAEVADEEVAEDETGDVDTAPDAEETAPADEEVVTDETDDLFVDPRFRETPPADDAELTQEEMDRLAMSTTLHEAVVEEGADQRLGARANLANFRPGNIISDAVFYDRNAMTQAQIASFISSRVSCGSSGTCLPNYRENTNSRAADQYCNGYTGANNETAAQIIYKVAQSCGLNPQAILVKLQKEQGLITMSSPSTSRYRIAMGMGCPDTAACDTRYYGFQNQVYSGVRQLILYGQSSYFTWYDPGATRQVQYHPNASCGSSGVYVENKATAALYYYTPYQPNQAALNAGYGTGNSCSAYGNRNFYNYFNDWFGSTTTPPVDECREPTGTSTTTRTYVTVTSGVDARISPRENCTRSMVTLDSGTIMQGRAVAASGNWVEVLTPSGRRWVAATDVREATTAESRCAVASGASGAQRIYTLTRSVTGRSAPRANCEAGSTSVEAGWTVQATSVTASGAWLRVRTPAGQKWIPRDAVDYATAAEERCTQPAGGVRAASHTFVATTSVLARIAPRSECSVGTTRLERGTEVQAVEASGSGDWIRVRTESGLSWVPRASFVRATPENLACFGAVGDTRSASYAFTANRAVTARIVPDADCARESSGIAADTVVRAVEATADGTWIRVNTGTGRAWVPRASFTRATTSEVRCVQPSGGVRAASYAFTVSSGTSARIAPRAGCDTRSSQLAAGTVVQAVSASGSGDWILVQTGAGNRWVARADVTRASTAEQSCLAPNGGVGPAVKSYRVTQSTTARLAPRGGCDVGAQSLPSGRVITATAVTGSGQWLEFQTSNGPRWVNRDHVVKIN